MTSPKCQEKGPNRVGRGGSWFVNAGYCRTAFRGSYRPVRGSDDFGVRLVLKPATSNITMTTNKPNRVLRGGVWYGDAYFARRAYRFNNSPDYAYLNFGFRPVLKKK